MGRVQPRFGSDVLPPDEAAWVSERLWEATTPDAVRAVFERQRLGQWEDETPLDAPSPEPVAAPSVETPTSEPTNATGAATATPADPLAAIREAAALVERMAVMSTAASIEQVRELRAQVMAAISGM